MRQTDMTDSRRDDTDGYVVVCGGSAKSGDDHLASIVHAEDDEIINFLKRRERQQKRKGSTP